MENWEEIATKTITALNEYLEYNSLETLLTNFILPLQELAD